MAPTLTAAASALLISAIMPNFLPRPFPRSVIIKLFLVILVELLVQMRRQIHIRHNHAM